MEYLKKLTPLMTAVITFCAVFTALGLMFNILLGSVKTNLIRLEKDIIRVETEIKSVETELKAEIKSVKTELNSRMDRIETKLDLLLSDKRRPASSDK